MIDRLSITCADGARLQGAWFRSTRPASATVVVAPGAAAEARFYVPFCEYLVNKGVDVLAFDFRGIGESADPARRKRDSGFTDWIDGDFPAVIAHARQNSRARPLIVVGHSAGGWMAGVQPFVEEIDAIIGVAALSGHWRHMAAPHRYAHWLAWSAVVPATCHLLGIWPGVIGFRKNLAARFGLEFSRWARHPDFVFSEPRFARNALKFRGAMHLFQVADDPWGTEAAVEAFSVRFPNASSRTTEVIPHPIPGQAPIGHFGMFRRSSSESLWPRITSAIHKIAAAHKEHSRAQDFASDEVRSVSLYDRLCIDRRFDADSAGIAPPTF